MSDELDTGTEADLESRIAERFAGLPHVDPEEGVPDGDPNEPTTFDYEMGGKKFTLPAELKSIFDQASDYTQKTQEIANQRRSLEQAHAQAMSNGLVNHFNESVASERNELAVIDAYLAQVAKSDWSQMSLEQVMRSRIEIDNVKERRAAIAQSISDKRSKFDTEMKSRMNELRAKSREAASKSIQNFSEDTEKELRAFATSEGLTDSEFDTVTLDPRSTRIIWKAMQFDKVKAGTQRAQRRVETPTLKPGPSSERMPAGTRQNLEFRKAMKTATNSAQKANVIEGRLAQRFGGNR